MSDTHPAFFGNTEGGVPADLVPFLEAADTPDEESGEATAEHSHAMDSEEEADRVAALRALLEDSLLVGPDPTILSEITGEGEDNDVWEDEDGTPVPDEDEHALALDEAQRQSVLADEFNAVYTSIIARAPEHKVQPSLDRVRAVLDLIADPQNTYPSVHITGTNGKTSTARMVDALLTTLGMRVGRFTSPHLHDARERISIEGEALSYEAFIDAWQDVKPYIEMIDEKSRTAGGEQLSFFEVFTVMAYAAFSDYPVDAAVIEVGMGGQWDATNVISSDVAVIMPIDLDHAQWLGSDIRDVAREKAGIIKPRQTVVIAKQRSEVLDILVERAHEVDAVVRLEGTDFDVISRQVGVGGQLVSVRTPSAVYEDLFIPLHGEYQAHNAGAALVAVEALLGGRPLNASVVEDGFTQVTSPGRLEVARTSPTIIVDAAHNPAGARTLGVAVEESFGFAHTVGVFSAMADKNVEAVLSEVEPFFEHIVITSMSSERAMPTEELGEIARDVFGDDRVDVHEDFLEALERAASLVERGEDPADTGGVVIFGSIVLAGEALALLRQGVKHGN